MPEKCFNFELTCTSVKKGYVYAENEEEARRMINSGCWCECDEVDFTIDDLSSLYEDK